MQDKSQEIYVVILIGIVLALTLVGFIILIFFLYQRRRQRHERELVKMKEEFQQELLRSQLEIQEATMKTIAQELHDNIGQVLSVVKLWLAIAPIDKDHPAYEGITNSRQMLNKAGADLSDLTKSLHTDRISEIGLVEAIEFEIETLRKTGLITVDFEVLGFDPEFDSQTSIFMFRMFQEIMNNMLKHAKATQVRVAIDCSTDNTFVMEITDNGVGFDVKQKREQTHSSSGLGLKSMINRAKLIGAEISIRSEPGKGTSIKVIMPLEAETVQPSYEFSK